MTVQEYSKVIDRVNENGPYQATWASLSRHKTPDWYADAKFGIFIHWGIYSVPAFGNEWYSRTMYDPACREYAHHIRTYGSQKEFGYKDFIPLFRGEHFDAGKWAALFKKAGARYVMPVAEHHDGFAMYETAFNRWNAKDMGPKRNVVGELKEACEKQGLAFCASTHRAEHYFFMNMGRTIESDIDEKSDCFDFYAPAVYCEEFGSSCLSDTTANTFAVGASEEWLEDWLVRTCELIDRYRPRVLYFDWWIHNQCFKPYLKRLAAYYYNRAAEWGEEVTINYKHKAFAPGAATFDVERGALVGISPVKWQTDTAIGKNSWGYTRDNEFKTTRQLVCDLIDIVSKNGNLLLNVGPLPDGTFTPEETAVLLGIGAWLRTNGEGIFDTTFFETFGEGEVNALAGQFQDGDEKAFTDKDFRFTYKDGSIYAFQMRPSKFVCIKTLAKKEREDIVLQQVHLLGGGETEFVRDSEGLKIKLKNEPENDLPQCFRIILG